MFKANLYLAACWLALVGIVYVKDGGLQPVSPSVVSTAANFPSDPAVFTSLRPQVLPNDPEDDCLPTHLAVNQNLSTTGSRYYGSYLESLQGYLTASPGYTFSTGGSAAGPLVAYLNRDGAPISAKRIDMPGADGAIEQLRYYSSGGHFAVGNRRSPNGNYLPFVAHFFPLTALDGWVTVLEESTEPFYDLQQYTFSNDLVAFGHAAATDSPTGFRAVRSQRVHWGTGNLVAGGRMIAADSDLRFQATRLSGSGWLSVGYDGTNDPLITWTDQLVTTARARRWSNPAGNLLTAHQQLLVDGSRAHVLTRNAAATTELVLATVTPGGDLTTSRAYAAPGIDLTPVDLVPFEGGLLLAATTTGNQLVLVSTAADGSVRWANHYPDFLGGGTDWRGALGIQEGQIVVTGAVPAAGTTTSAALRLFADGSIDGDCTTVIALSVTERPLPLTVTDVPLYLSDYETGEYQFNGGQPIISDAFQAQTPASCGNFCNGNTNCEELFYYTYDDLITNGNSSYTNFLDLERTEDRIYAVGQIKGFASVACLNLDGTVRWSVRSSLPESRADRIILDPDGTLTVAGSLNSNQTLPNAPPGELLAWRLNRVTGATIWARRYQASGRPGVFASDLRQEAPGGAIEIIGAYDATSVERPVHWRLNPADGQLADATEYDTGYDKAGFEASVTGPDGTVYELLSFNLPGGAGYGIRATGPQNWTRYYATTYDRTRGQSYLMWYAGQLHLVGVATRRVNNVNVNALIAARFTPTGQLVGAQFVPVRLDQLFGAAAGTTGVKVVLATTSLTGVVVLNLDAQHTITSERAYSNLFPVPYYQQQLTTYDDLVLIPFQSFLSLGVNLISASSDVNQQLPCLPQLPNTTVLQPFTLTTTGGSFTPAPVTVNSQSATLVAAALASESISCRPPCLLPEICDNGIDDDNDGLTDCEDDDLAGECCCAADPDADLGPDAPVCADTVLAITSTVEIAEYLWSDGSTLPTLPVTGPGTYSVEVTDACGRTANDTIVLLPVAPPVLDLGPDLTVCPGELPIIDAGTDFATYAWADGTTGPVRVISLPGTYRLTATDACGGVAEEEISVSFTGGVPGRRDTLVFCAQDSFVFDDQVYYAESGELYLTPPVADGGCVLRDTLIVLPPVGFAQLLYRDTLEICAGESALIHGQEEDQSGTYVDEVFPGINCYIRYERVLRVRPVPETIDTLRVCAGDSILVRGVFRTAAGRYVDTLTAASGCDSLLITDLFVNPRPDTAIAATICSGSSLFLAGADRSVSGVYRDTLPASTGCDSIVSTTLTVLPPVVTERNLSICSGQSVLLAGADRSAEGVYRDTLTAASGCDSIVSTMLTVLPVIVLERELTICSGQSVLLAGADRSLPGVYVDSLATMTGCDSIVRTTLTVSEALMSQTEVRVCAGDSVLVHDRYVTVPGTYVDTVAAAGGCDSVSLITVSRSDLAATAELLSPTCAGAAAGAVRVTTSGGEVPYAYRWSNDATTAVVTDLPAGATSVTVTDGAGCSEILSIDVPSEAVEAPAVTSTASGCPESADGSLLVTNPAPGYTYRLNDGPFTGDTAWADLPPAAYTVTAESPSGCRAVVAARVDSALSFSLHLRPRLISPLNLGDSVVLSVATDLPDTTRLRWYADDELLCADCRTLTVRPEAATRYRVTGGPAACPLVASLLVPVDDEEPFYVPTAFSPNGDGMNDVFRLYPGPAVRTILGFVVYDRWGGQLFNAESTRPGDEAAHWDGTRNGDRPVPVGVYVYQAEVELFDGRIVKRAGEVMVLR